MIMSAHWTQEEVERFADGESTAGEEHLRDCAPCANAVVAASRMKQVVRDAMQVDPAPASLRRRIGHDSAPRTRWWLATAAAVAIAVIGAVLLRENSAARRAPSTLSQLADLHVTLLAGTNPVDVLSTDRHTVKPWFEGRVPFAVPVPDLTRTAFRLIGGRVVYVAGRQAAYLLIGKGAHRISLFVLRATDAPPDPGRPPAAVSTLSWQDGGLAFIAVGDVPAADLAVLREQYGKSAP
jgi:anti-sigma factor RsiW